MNQDNSLQPLQLHNSRKILSQKVYGVKSILGQVLKYNKSYIIFA